MKQLESNKLRLPSYLSNSIFKNYFRFRKYTIYDPDATGIENEENIPKIVNHILKELNLDEKVCQGQLIYFRMI
jgi:hypothetical protein